MMRTTEIFLEQLRRKFPHFYVMIGDPNKILDSLPGWHLDRPLIIVNPYRRYSLSLTFRATGYSLHEDDQREILDMLAKLAKLCFKKGTRHILPEPLVDVNYAYQVVILHYAEANKAAAMPYLLDHYGPIVMVGNSSNDYLAKNATEPSPAIQLAVGNASSAYKLLCEFSSNLDLTLGAEVCARWIVENTPRLLGK